MNEEEQQEEQAERPEKAERVTIFQWPATFSLRDANGQEIAAGEAQAQLDTEALSILPQFGEALLFPLRDILGVSAGNYQVLLALTSKEELVLRELGYHYEDFLKNLSKQRNEVLLNDMLMAENLRVSGMEADFVYVDEAGQEAQRGHCEPRLYETALVILPEIGDPLRLPYGDIAGISAQDYVLAITTDFGEKFVFSGMARQFEPFCRDLSESINAVVLKVQSSLKELLPKSDPAVIRKVARLMKEGKAARRSDIEAIFPELWVELEDRLEACGIKESYDFLKSLSRQEDICIGLKRGLLGDLTGEYIWFLIPIHSADGEKPGNAVAMEAASENGGKATYFFRIVSRAEYPNLSDLAVLQQRWSALVKTINRCMVAVNFRREPIYLPEEKLDDPQYSHYRFAIQRLPALQTLRHLFIGRVVHSSPEQWKRDVSDLLAFNVSTRDDDAKWTKAKGRGT